MTEKQKFEQWFNEETKKGLMNFHVTISPNINTKKLTIEETKEAIYKELNSLNTAIKENRLTPFEDF